MNISRQWYTTLHQPTKLNYMTRIKILTRYDGQRFQENAQGIFGKRVVLHCFKDIKTNWKIEIDKKNACFSGLEIKKYYTDEGDELDCWELEFEETAGEKINPHDDKERCFWDDGHINHINVKFQKQEREREREQNYQFKNWNTATRTNY